jgi:hypothetical protein
MIGQIWLGHACPNVSIANFLRAELKQPPVAWAGGARGLSVDTACGTMGMMNNERGPNTDTA